MTFLLELADPWSYVLVFVLAFAEGAFLLGLFLPGETAMILAGVLASQGRAGLAGILLAACAGSVAGDSVGYWVGRRFGGRVVASRLGRKVGAERWERARSFIRDSGARAVFFGRFLGFLRTLVPPVAGMAGMPYRRFAAFNVPAATLWASVFVLAGVAAGESWHAVERWAGRGSAALVVLIAGGIGLWLAARWVRGRVEAAVERGRGWLDGSTTAWFRQRAEPQLRFLRRRADPAGRFGLFFTAAVVLAVLSAAALAVVVEGAADGEEVARADTYVLDFFAERRSPTLDSVASAVAAAGAVEWVAGLVAVAVFVTAVVTRRWEWLLFGAATVGGVLFVDDVVRSAVAALGASPDELAAGEAFPSPQLTAGSAVATAAAFVTARSRSGKAAIVAISGAALVLLGVSVAFLYLGWQTPSSLTAGFSLGVLWASIVVAGWSVFRV